MRTIFAATFAAFLLSACAGNPGNPEIAAAPVAQSDTDECQALVWDGRGTLPENYDCDTEMGSGIYHLTTWSNNGRNVQRIRQFASYRDCAIAESFIPSVFPQQVPEFAINEVWCVRQDNR